MFKKTILVGTVAVALGSGLTQAQQPPAAPASPHTLTGNVGFFSQYIFRGLTQTDRKPAVQGGFDYSHASGFYAGTWGSNISWLRDNGTYSGGGSLEWDFYGGYKWGFAPDWTLDLGTLYYWYPGTENTLGNPLNVKADTWEIYGGLSWKWLSAKYSYAVSNKVFGTRDADGTWYLDLSATVPLGDYWKDATGFSIIGHWGYQKYSGTDPRNPTVTAISPVRFDNDTLFSYKDWKLGLSYALPKDFTIGAYYTKAYGTNAVGYGTPAQCLRAGVCGVYPHELGKGTGTVYVQKTF
ncbi:MAG TPA: TorF family putative porin [Burkholderiales bacterium]|nr:TorF family putative porin [Burkholderiales bacterium]